ncbi:AI-2E family transporter [Peptostreptococcus faecalis]|uniref:AI-2E family transporter n=1 Tax=Peptostreptococcus faecalis TaxID=2045015 RepID=UPI000C7B52D1|nr:AI-2E family transporter [Peptostreptococcus faecalis]
MEVRMKKIYSLLILTGVILAVVVNSTSILEWFRDFIVVLNPIIIGCVMAFILNILVVKWESVYFVDTKNKIIIKTKRGVCILLSILSVLLILFFVSKLILPQVNKSISLFIQQFPTVYDKILRDIIEYSEKVPFLKNAIIPHNLDGKEIIEKVMGISANWVGGIFSLLGSFLGLIANLVIAFILAIYIVASKERLCKQFNKVFNKILSQKFIKKFYYILDITNSTFRSFFIGQFLEAIVLGSLCTLGMYILGIPYPPMIGSVVGLTALIPLVGAYIGGGFGFIMIITHSFFDGIAFVIFLIILQQFEGNVIYPKVVGTSVGLPGLWVLVAILVGGGLFGVTGVFFAVPVMATLYKLLENYVES